jgi:Zn-dependent peptidase ImmA (M78 family)
MDINIYGDRVRAARILRGFKAVELAAALDWPPSRQTLIEQAETVQLEDRSVEVLTKKLRFPQDYFSTSPGPALRPEEMLFRAPVSTTKREKAYLAEFARVAGEILYWLDCHHRLPPVKIPLAMPGSTIADAAREARIALGIDVDKPIGNLTHKLERAGLPIVVRSSAWSALPEKHLGYSTRVGTHRERPLTILRAQDSWERMRWTLAHEVGHHVLHSSVLPADAEGQAHEFAGELLAPASVIRPELPRYITLASLTELKLRWGISLGALILHLSRNDLISDERKDTLRKQLYARINPATGRTWGKDEPGWDTRQVELPSLINTWMQRCLGGSAPNLVANLSGIWPADIISMIIVRQRDASPSSRPRSRGQADIVPMRSKHKSVIDLEARRMLQA